MKKLFSHGAYAYYFSTVRSCKCKDTNPIFVPKLQTDITKIMQCKFDATSS